MNIKAGRRNMKVLAALETRHPYKGSMADTLQLVTETLPSKQDLDEWLKGNIQAEDGRVFSGYTGLVSVSVMLFKEDELMAINEETQRATEAFLELLDAAPDAVALKYIERFPSMQYNSRVLKKGKRINWNGHLMRVLRDIPDSPDNTPANRADAWEEVT